MSTKATNGPGPRPLAPGPCCRARVYRWRTDQTIAVEKALIYNRAVSRQRFAIAVRDAGGIRQGALWLTKPNSSLGNFEAFAAAQANLDHLARRQNLALLTEEPVCRICGCRNEDACVDECSGETCHWIEPDLCSACEKKGPEARGQGPGEAADEFLQRVRPEKKWAPDVKDEGERIKDEGAGTPNPEIPKSPIP